MDISRNTRDFFDRFFAMENSLKSVPKDGGQNIDSSPFEIFFLRLKMMVSAKNMVFSGFISTKCKNVVQNKVHEI